jgi:L-prolyl-PCP dehydrogenase
MDFSWNDAQRELYEQSLRFARELSENRDPDEARHGAPFPERAWQQCANFGLAGLSVPEELGGLGLDALTTAHVVEAFGRGLRDTGLLFSASAHLFAVTMPLVEHASDELRYDMVPRLASGSWIGANAITEPGAGSDTASLATRAIRSESGYVLRGEKCFVTNAPVADVFLVYATTAPRAGYLGQTAFAVPRTTPGLTIGKPYEKTGLSTSPLASVHFDDCPIPERLRVGREGQGSRIFARSMAWERACLFAGFVGAMDTQLDACIEHARMRVQFGKPIAAHQAVSHRIAEMKRRLESARLLLYHACWLRDEGHDATLEISLAKLAISEAAVASGVDAMRIHGGSGYMKETGVDRGLLDGLGSTIFSGTSDIQRELIAHRLIGGTGSSDRARRPERRQHLAPGASQLAEEVH